MTHNNGLAVVLAGYFGGLLIRVLLRFLGAGDCLSGNPGWQTLLTRPRI